MRNEVMQGISVIMPTYNQGAFISRAINSLLLQGFEDWELIIINDGATDYTEEVITEYLTDKRIRYFRNERNMGLGSALNKGISLSAHSLIAYLPSDDVYFSDHLQALYDAFHTVDNCMISYTGMMHGSADNTFFHGALGSYTVVDGILQLVQVLHRKTDKRWTEREVLVTDDLNKMYWEKIWGDGMIVPTEKITCEWVNHPFQRHKLIRETSHTPGGIYAYKKHYRVKKPIRFHSTVGNFIDEKKLSEKFGKAKEAQRNGRSLKILLVGELAFNAERVCALEDWGHQLYGLWAPAPEFYNTIGPLPFGNIEDIPFENWEERVKELKPDIIYALLNYGAIPIAYEVLSANTGIPFIWHFKEGPFFARQYGMWKELAALYTNSDGLIFINEQMRDWVAQFISFGSPTFIMDGDLPKKDWFIHEPVELLSTRDGEIHTLIPGRPFGVNPIELEKLVDQKIHLHFYGEYFHTVWRDWLKVAQEMAPGYVHVHPHCTAEQWATEFAKYDAGWLHAFDSNNSGELMKASWNDLNYPARMNTLAAAGLPMIQKDNKAHLVATQSLVKELDIGYFYQDLATLWECFADKDRCKVVRNNIWEKRFQFSFDFYVKDLTDFFFEVIAKYQRNE